MAVASAAAAGTCFQASVMMPWVELFNMLADHRLGPEAEDDHEGHQRPSISISFLVRSGVPIQRSFWGPKRTSG